MLLLEKKMSRTETVINHPRLKKLKIKPEKRPAAKLTENNISLKVQSKVANYPDLSTSQITSQITRPKQPSTTINK
jgi:hypothetical protein